VGLCQRNAYTTNEAFFAGYGEFGVATKTYQLGTSGSTLFFSNWGNAIFGPSLQTGTWYNVAVTNVGDSVTLYLRSPDKTLFGMQFALW